MYDNYKLMFHDHYVSWGTFNNLQLFYVRSVTKMDMEMCCCKTHLHARHSINAFIDCCHKQNIDITPIQDYTSFFNEITKNCEPDETAYISWDCTPDKREDIMCKLISKNCDAVRKVAVEKSDKNVTVPHTL